MYVISHFTLGAFNILSLSLIFVSLITMCFGVFLLGYSVCLLDFIDYFLSHALGKFSAINSSNIFSGPLFCFSLLVLGPL